VLVLPKSTLQLHKKVSNVCATYKLKVENLAMEDPPEFLFVEIEIVVHPLGHSPFNGLTTFKLETMNNKKTKKDVRKFVVVVFYMEVCRDFTCIVKSLK
jgi:hypothetical protein